MAVRDVALRFPWTAQPPEGIRANLAYPLTCLVDYSGRDLTSNRVSFAKSSTAMARAPTRSGIGLSNASGGNLVGSGDLRRAFAVNNNSFTVFGIFSNQLSGVSSRYFAQMYDGTNQAAVISGYVADTIEFFAPGYTGTDPRPGSQITVTDNLPHAFCYTYDGATWAGYLDGKLIFSLARVFSLNLATPTSTTLMSAIGAAAESRSTLLLWGAMDRGIGGLGQSITANPWQLFAPLPRRIWAPTVAAGGNAAVTLGSAAATSSAGAVTVLAGASVAVTSAAATAGAGTVSAIPGVTVAIVGASATSATGTVSATGNAVVAIAGAAATASAGTVTAVMGAIATITGAAVASAAGMITVTAGASTMLASAAATGSAGNVSATNGAAVASSIRFDLSTGRIIKIINRSVTISF